MERRFEGIFRILWIDFKCIICVFEDFEDAERFFTGCGFAIIDKITKPAMPLSAWQYTNPEKLAQQQFTGISRMRETWVLQIA